MRTLRRREEAGLAGRVPVSSQQTRSQKDPGLRLLSVPRETLPTGFPVNFAGGKFSVGMFSAPTVNMLHGLLTVSRVHCGK